jgi:hypothetical protein
MRKTFSTTKEVREFLVKEGFPEIKKGAVKGEFIANGKKATFSLQIIGKTGQSSTGAGWGFVVNIQ